MRRSDAEKVDAVMLVEVRILGGDKGEPYDLGNFMETDGNSIFSKKTGDDPSFHVVNVGGQFRVKIDLVQRRDVAEVPRHHAGHGPDGNGDGKCQNDDESSAPLARAGLSAQRTDTSVQENPMQWVLYHASSCFVTPSPPAAIAGGRSAWYNTSS